MKDLIMLNSKKEEKCNEECIVCEAPLVYLEKDELMECVLCHKKEFSKTRCQNGHYVCNDCHTKGMDVIISMCLKEPSQNPIEIIRTMMNASFFICMDRSIMLWLGQRCSLRIKMPVEI